MNEKNKIKVITVISLMYLLFVKNELRIPNVIISSEMVIDQKSLNFQEKFKGIYDLKLNELVSFRISSKAEIAEN